MMKLVRSPDLGDAGQFEHSEKRYGVVLSAQIVGDECPEPVSIRICNISAGGLMAIVPPTMTFGGCITVVIRHVGKLLGRIVWRQKDKVGIKFDKEIDPVALLADRAERALAPSQMANKFVELTKRTMAFDHVGQGAVGLFHAI